MRWLLQSERGQQNRSRALTKSTFAFATKHGNYTPCAPTRLTEAVGHSQIAPRNRSRMVMADESSRSLIKLEVERAPRSEKAKRIRSAGLSPGINSAPYTPQQSLKRPKAFEPGESIAVSFSRILNSISKSNRQVTHIQPVSPPRPHAKPIKPSKELALQTLRKHDATATVQRLDHTPQIQPLAAAIISSLECLKTGVSEHSSFVYFACVDGSNPRIPSIDPRDNVQVGCIVRSLASGDCVVQLLKCVSSDVVTKTRAYVPTEHWIECCGSQLHNIQNISFHRQSQTWQWQPAAAAPMPTPLPLIPSRRDIAAMKALESYSYQVVARIVCSPIDIASPVRIKEIQASNSYLLRFNDWTPQPKPFAVPLSPTLFPTVHVALLAGLTRQQLWRTHRLAV